MCIFKIVKRYVFLCKCAQNVCLNGCDHTKKNSFLKILG